jgi:flagellar hook-associated protein 3 FlgL
MSFPLSFSPLLKASTTQRHLSTIQADLSRVTEAAVTGLEVREPSDAPGRWHGILDLQAGLDDQPRYQANATSATSLLATVDTALGEATDAMDRAREIAVQMSSETYNDEDRALVAAEVDALRAQLITIGNTAMGDRYVFAGLAYDLPPFNDVTGVYGGSNTTPEAIVGRDQRVQTGLDGSTIFPDAIAALEALSTALRQGPGSATATQALLDPLEAAQDLFIEGRAQAGFAFNDAEDALQIAQNLELTFQTALDGEIAADPIATYTRLAELKGSYEAALQVSARSGGTSLFELLR